MVLLNSFVVSFKFAFIIIRDNLRKLDDSKIIENIKKESSKWVKDNIIGDSYRQISYTSYLFNLRIIQGQVLFEYFLLPIQSVHQVKRQVFLSIVYYQSHESGQS